MNKISNVNLKVKYLLLMLDKVKIWHLVICNLLNFSLEKCTAFVAKFMSIYKAFLIATFGWMWTGCLGLDASPTATNSPLLAPRYLPWRLLSIFFLFGSFLGKGKRISVLLQMRQTVAARVSLTFPFLSFWCCGFCFFVFSFLGDGWSFRMMYICSILWLLFGVDDMKHRSLCLFSYLCYTHSSWRLIHWRWEAGLVLLQVFRNEKVILTFYIIHLLLISLVTFLPNEPISSFLLHRSPVSQSMTIVGWWGIKNSLCILHQNHDSGYPIPTIFAERKSKICQWLTSFNFVFKLTIRRMCIILFNDFNTSLED